MVDLGLIYNCDIKKDDKDDYCVSVDMTLTAPGCGMADVLVEDIKERIALLPKIQTVNVELVLDPPWSMEIDVRSS